MEDGNICSLTKMATSARSERDLTDQPSSPLAAPRDKRRRNRSADADL
jgi:hypothetical protein